MNARDATGALGVDIWPDDGAGEFEVGADD